jgi:hypothetical protein
MSYTSKIIAADGQREIPFPLHPIFQVVASSDMPSGVSFFHSAIPADAPGAPPHVHENEDEIYYILEIPLISFWATASKPQPWRHGHPSPR